MKRNKALTVLAAAGILICLGVFACAEETAPKVQGTADAYEGWHLGIQAYSFKEYTFFEAIDKTASLGLHFIEGYWEQPFSPEKRDSMFNHKMSPQLRKEVKDKLASAGVKMAQYGVVWLTNNETQCREVFDFAKEMGVETIISEPPLEAMDIVEKLCEEYKIKVAIHNHPAPSLFWDPNAVAKACEGRSKLIGACADTGHWMRSGLDPVNALKKLDGRVITLHLKDLKEVGDPNVGDVIWGTGKADIKAILNELVRQNFKGIFSIEYENNWLNSVPDIRESVNYFNKVASELKSSK